MALEGENKLAVQAGFKFGHCGPHSSRTLMLAEVSKCLDALPATASLVEYRAAIVDRNLLSKDTVATRRESFRRLRELYALDPATPLFGIFRALDTLDTISRPLLLSLLASARDPLLRGTIPVITGAREGDALSAAAFDDALRRAFPGHIKDNVRAATARHIASTWTQSGHLTGRTGKRRLRVDARPAAATMALVLGAVQGVSGPALFATPWCQLLDLNAAQGQTLAMQAHREGLLDLRAAGSIVEIGFPRFRDALQAGGLHEPL